MNENQMNGMRLLANMLQPQTETRWKIVNLQTKRVMAIDLSEEQADDWCLNFWPECSILRMEE